MNCKEFEKKIPDFIKNQLEYKELSEFVEHVENCEDCREELTIQFLVAEGMARLVEGGAFDLQKELDVRMAGALRGLRRHNAVKYLGITLGIVAILGIVVIAYVLTM
ncbi:MAG: zf-HC2 domain-containing protein [Lachnospiraceae bacterium]|nr:zf-HC2 domain-containing protein [Lachnospiraceae bacterium]